MAEQTYPARNRWSWGTWWWQELLSIVASLGCLIAVCVILSKMENKPRSHWTFFVSDNVCPAPPPPRAVVRLSSHLGLHCSKMTVSRYCFFQISLNATIAAFIAAAKSFAMLSVATCIGQWKWIYYQSKRQLEDFDILDQATRGPYGSIILLKMIPRSGLATFGAIIIILALGIDTFVQQVIVTDSIITWVNDNGSASFNLADGYYTGSQIGGNDDIFEPDRK